MASELVAPLSTLTQGGLTVTARILGPTGTVLSSSVSCPETGAGTAVYVGNMPGATAAGFLTVQFYSSAGPLLWVYQDYWTGSVWTGQQSSAFPANFSALSIDGSGRVDVAKLAGQTVTAAAGVTFPASVASPTNITAATGVVLSATVHTGATIPTVTTLTNLPAITAGWITATGIAAGALNGKGDWLTGLGTNAPAGWINAAAIAASAFDGKGDWTTDADLPVNLNTLSIANGQTIGTSTYAGGDTSGTTTLLSRLSAPRAGYLDNLSAGAVALASGVTVTTNNDKTGYSLSQAFPANFDSLGITAGGKISGVVLTDTLTDYTGNTPQSGDAYARLGAAGAGLTALGDARLAHLDANVSSRFAAVTWTSQWPADFTAATFASAGVFATAALANAPTGGGGGGATAAEIRQEMDANSTQLAKLGTPANGTIAADIAALQAAGDPWLTDNLGTYPAGSAGAGMYRIVQTPGDGPVAVIPAPANAGECTVYINTTNLPGAAVVGGAKIFIVPDPLPATGGDFILDPSSRGGVYMVTDESGYAAATFPVDSTSGTAYRFTCDRLGMDATVTLESGVFDLATLSVNPAP